MQSLTAPRDKQNNRVSTRYLARSENVDSYDVTPSDISALIFSIIAVWPLSQIPELIHRQDIQPLARWKTVSLHQFRIVPSPSVLFSQPTHLEIRVVPNLDLIGTFSGAKVGVNQLLLFHMQNNEWTAVNEVCKSVQILSGSKLPFLKLCLTVLGWDDDHSLRHLACLLSCYHYVSTTSRVVLSAVQNIQANIWFHQMWRLQKPKKTEKYVQLIADQT